MISKRYKRSSGPQESLKQFSINNSKGVDITKPPTDRDTVFKANNLIVNPDGSMSLRKPIKMVEGTATGKHIRTFYLYDGVSKLDVGVFNNGVGIRLSTNGVYQFYDLVMYDYKGIERKIDVSSAIGADKILNGDFVIGIVLNSDLSVINTSSTSILCNATVQIGTLEGVLGVKVYDPDLYDKGTINFNRYVHIRYAEDDKRWILEIKNPEMNTLTSAEGEISFNPNLTLDNPTALRDTYNTVVPSVKGILAYVPTKLVNGTPAYDAEAMLPEPRETVSDEVSVEVVANSENKDPQSGYGQVFQVSERYFQSFLSLSVGLSEIDDSSVANVSASATISLDLTKPSEDKSSFKVEATLNTHTVLKFTNGSTRAYDEAVVFGGIINNENPFVTYIKLPKNPAQALDPLESISVRVTCNAEVSQYVPKSIKISEITESVKKQRFRISSSVPKVENRNLLLKAFCNLPAASDTYYAAWFQSIDGIVWEPADNLVVSKDAICVRELDPLWEPDPYVSEDEVSAPSNTDYVTLYYRPLQADSERDVVDIAGTDSAAAYYGRPDIAVINVHPDSPNFQYRFKIIAVSRLSKDDVEYDPDGERVQYRVRATVGQSEYTPIFKNDFEFFEVDIGNASKGKKLYHKKSIYSYGDSSFMNNILVSDVGSFITPLYNLLDLDTYSASQATCIVPWRDYLISATPNALYLHSRDANGFYTKTVNTSIGIPEEDYRCCKPILNGVVFKSGSKVYQAYPNMYSGDDSTLNVTDISKAVEDILESYEVYDALPLAFSTDTEYVLMLPNESYTTCLRYDYSTKLWTLCTYPIVVTDYRIVSLNDVHIFGIFGDSYAEFVFDANCDDDSYADVLKDTSVPIHFEWDTGQKTDAISQTKQFVESKLMFATLGTRDNFPFTLYVAIDGDPHVTKTDVSTDAPFWKSENSLGAVGTAFSLGSTSPASGNFNTLRQLVTRYSGKGKSIRHVIEGASSCNFKLYETHVRYKILNTK